MSAEHDPESAFIDAACVPLDRAHVSGTLDEAQAILAAHPEIVDAGIHIAAVLGHAEAVRSFLIRDPGLATAELGGRGWDALTYLCFSRYLRLDPARSEGFVRAAEALLDAGAHPNTGWHDPSERPPQWESVLYGAAGIAHHPELTRLLLERGADPNAEEVVYHAPETYDNRVLQLVVETGTLTDENLSLLLIRKLDWHDYEGVRYLLENGADPTRPRWRGLQPLHHAIHRDNARAIIGLLLDHAADPTAIQAGRAAVALAARRGRGDLLDLFEQHGVSIELQGADRLIAACARNDAGSVRAIVAAESRLADEVLAEGGTLLTAFAGNGNAAGVRRLLDLGLEVTALYEGDPYFGTPENSTALHVAAWRAQHGTVRLLIERGAPVDVPDGAGRTPLALAVRACVHSYWTHRRAPDSVEALLAAGASADDIGLPTGYPEVDELIRRHRH